MTPSTRPSLRAVLAVFAFSAFVAVLSGCGGAAEPAAEAPAAEPATVEEEGAGAAESATSYEPAFPEEVSGEELSEDDTQQQEAAHSHDDGEPHEHEAGEENGHSHDDGDHQH
jgi:hypothetical protein